MLSQTKVVNTRKAIESLYTGECSITEYKKIKKQNGSTGFRETMVIEHQPCRISFKTIASAKEGAMNQSITQVIKLFIAPEIVVKTGSKITVTQNNITTEYKSSGKPAMYATHQEIILELFDGWS